MATTKVSALAAHTTTDGAEELLINDGGTSKKVTIANLLPDSSIDSKHYVDGSIDNEHIADNAIDSEHYTDRSIDRLHIAENIINAEHFADDVIHSSHYSAGSIDTEHIANDQITNALMADDAIDSDQIADDAVDNAHLADDAVDSDQIADGAVDNVHLADDAVDSDELAAGAVDIAHLSASGSAGSSTFLRGDNSWVTPTDTDTTYSAGSSSALGLIKLEDDATQTTAASAITTTSSRTYGLQINSSGQGVVNVPWTDTDTNTMGAGFTVSATTDTNATTITVGEDLMFTAGTGVTCETTADGTVTIANVGYGKQTIYVPANAMTPTTSNGCAAIAAVETTSGRPDMYVLDFDKDSDEFAQFTVAFPKSWNLGTVTYQVFWSGIASADDVDWMVDAVAMNDNETIDVAYGGAVVVTDNAQGAVEELLVSDESSAVTIAGTPADNDLTYFRIGTDVSGDAMAGDARLHGVKIFYTTDAINDA